MRVRLTMADGSTVDFEHEVPAGTALQAMELDVQTREWAPVVVVPFHLHGRALHTICRVYDDDPHLRLDGDHVDQVEL